MANAERGEVELRLGGKTYTLRPTFEALCEIESRLGIGLVELGTRMNQGRFGIRDLAVIVHSGATACGHEEDLETIGAAISERGLRKATEAVSAFFAQLSDDGEEKKAEAQDSIA